MNSITDEIAATIGKLWEKDTLRRYYISADKVRELIGLEVTRYGTGNVSYAELNGEKISNAKGSSYYRIATNCKFYVENGIVRSSTDNDITPLLATAVEKLAKPVEMPRTPIVNAHTHRKNSLLLTLRKLNDNNTYPTMAELMRADDSLRRIPTDTQISRRSLINQMAHAGLIDRLESKFGKSVQVTITSAGREALAELAD